MLNTNKNGTFISEEQYQKMVSIHAQLTNLFEELGDEMDALLVTDFESVDDLTPHAHYAMCLMALVNSRNAIAAATSLTEKGASFVKRYAKEQFHGDIELLYVHSMRGLMKNMCMGIPKEDLEEIEREVGLR